MKPPCSIHSLEDCIHECRGKRVMLDQDLAALYGVTRSDVSQAVRRNPGRFPKDFMFRLTPEEQRRQSPMGPSKRKRGRRAFAFTQEGVAMLSGLLRSSRAAAVNVAILRAFVRLRGLVAASVELSEKLSELENRLTRHDYAIASLLEAIRRLMRPPRRKTKRMGYI